MAGQHTCHICGKPYYRRNLTEIWAGQNPGHRDGWAKQVVRVCTKCQDQSVSSRLLIVAQATIAPRGVKLLTTARRRRLRLAS